METSASKEKLSAAPEEMKNPEDLRIGGIEGGGTQSVLIIIDGNGKKLLELQGPSTNHWVLGMKETAARVNAMIERAKEQLEIPSNVPLDCMGLCLSGCEEEESNNLLKKILLEEYPHASKDYVVGSDTLGSIKTGLENGGIVLIAGTGSNTVLVNPDGTSHSCGGWSYMIGDEGSGYWIAHRAFKYVFDDLDDFAKPPHPTTYVWSAMRNFFKAKDRNELLAHLYTKFDKSKFASFTIEIVGGCERNDPLCLAILEENGQLLARNIIAVAKKAHNDLKLAPGGLKVICVGSVFKSWKLMEKGFTKEINEASDIRELTLLRLTISSAFGACYAAAEKKNYPFEKLHPSTVTFFHYKRENYPQENVNSKNLDLYGAPNYVQCQHQKNI